ncbi:uncharacterized protein LOC116197288 [Punica granatum]|uniref:Uncharacterized protein LOC116197288 n=2 Tax=Punica granatum TaxID=22663 RepID=A0A6P8CPD1_PUNGR|nr:uncharacterized protein LOC116197288 [Punica granatum]XP_031383241.1 uncharacterized protein LOC116197288 [Punica granatum]PKI34944.1 hypothetical protein CRG98_044650 [Punica granatum]
MKRQNTTTLSSSSYRESINTSAETSNSNLHAKSIGCMSGIIQLVCKYHNRRKFLITFGKKSEKNIVVSSSHHSTRKPVESPTKSHEHSHSTSKDNGTPPSERPRRLSCEAPVRSPTLPPEIRRSNSVNSPQNFHSPTTPPPSLVARLMGLSEEPIVIPSESAVEKRRKLLGALEKCDQDLKALKKIIDAVRSTELAHQRPDTSVAAGAEDRCEELGKSNGAGEEQPSPVSVLDELARSPILTRCMKRQPNERLQHQPHQQMIIKTRKPGEAEDANFPPVVSLSDRIKLNTTESLPPLARRSSIPSPSPDHYDIYHQRSYQEESWQDSFPMKMLISRGMKESVEQVCRDVEWGERREVGRIGLALQDHICRDLIEETVKELGLFCKSSLSPAMAAVPPFEACKRRLSF